MRDAKGHTRRAAAVFDLDGTLLPDTSAELEFIRFARAHGYLSRLELIRRSVKWTYAIPWQGTTRNKTHFAGYDPDLLRKLGERFVREWLIERIPIEAVRTIDHHRSQDEVVGIVSGAPQLLIQSLKGPLNLAFVIGTQLEDVGGALTGRVIDTHVSGVRKVRAANKAARAMAFDLAQSSAYGNAYADRFLLSEVLTPVAVNPDSRLRRYAEENGWRILSYG